jgi:hypothetical protein
MYERLFNLIMEGSGSLGRIQRRLLASNKKTGKNPTKANIDRDLHLFYRDERQRFANRNRYGKTKRFVFKPLDDNSDLNLSVKIRHNSPSRGQGKRSIDWTIKKGPETKGDGYALMSGNHFQTKHAIIDPAHKGKGNYQKVLHHLKNTIKPKTMRPDYSLSPDAQRSWKLFSGKDYNEYGEEE